MIHLCVAALVVRSMAAAGDYLVGGESPCMTATSGVIVSGFTVLTAGVAQLVEHRFCKPRVVWNLTASSAGDGYTAFVLWASPGCTGKPWIRVDTQAAKGARL